MGYVVNFIWVDEGGELANSSSFAEFIFKSDCILESTGAGNSTNHGKVEGQNKTKGDMIRAGLSSLHVLIKDDLPESNVEWNQINLNYTRFFIIKISSLT